MLQMVAFLVLMLDIVTRDTALTLSACSLHLTSSINTSIAAEDALEIYGCTATAFWTSVRNCICYWNLKNTFGDEK